MHEIDVVGDDASPELTTLITSDANALLGTLCTEPAELCVVLMDDDGIQELNRTWRSKDTATDVLSFPQQEGSPTGGVLGDLVVSLETAARQASEAGHTLETEIRVLLVHGLCHLFGHDHMTKEEETLMLSQEIALLKQLGLGAEVRSLIDRARSAG